MLKSILERMVDQNAKTSKAPNSPNHRYGDRAIAFINKNSPSGNPMLMPAP